MKRDVIHHTLAPVFDGNSRILLLGTMPSPKSRQEGFYYMHPQNLSLIHISEPTRP